VSGVRISPGLASRLAADGFEVLGELGRGGMGVVYQARQIALRRLVALKMIRAGEGAGPEELARFRFEAEAVARLRHPNIIAVYHVGEALGMPYLVLEYLEGGSLADRIADQPQPIAEAAALVETLARAIHVAHLRGIVHRDLKPSNVLLAADGTPRITDFGLAKNLEGPDATLTRAVVGTAGYMSPEQAWGGGRLGEIGPPTDIHALGAVLYQLLTGVPPFRGDSAREVLEQVWAKEPTPPGRLRPGVPRDLETVFLKCLEKEPGRRYGSAEALADDLRRFLDGRPIHARPAGRLAIALRWCRRNPWATLAGSLFLLALAGGLSGAVFGWRAEAHRRRAEIQSIRAEQQERLAELEHERALRTDDANRIAQAGREWDAGRLDRAAEILDECPPARRHWEWRYLRDLCRGPARVLRLDRDRLVVAGSADGSRIAAVSSIALVPVGEKTLRVEPGAGWIWETITGRQVVTFQSPEWWFSDVAFSADGSWVATGGSDGAVRIWDATLGQQRRVLLPPGSSRRIERVAIDPGGRLLAAAGEGRLRVLNLDEGATVWTSTDLAGEITGLAFSANGTCLTAASITPGAIPVEGDRENLRGLVTIWSARDGRPLRVIDDERTRDVGGLAWSPDGQTLAVADGGAHGAAPGVVRLWDPSDGREVRDLLGHDGPVRAVVFHPEGRWLATGGDDRAIRLWDAATGRPGLVLRGHTAGVRSLTWPGSGATLISSANDGTVRLWDPRAIPGRIEIEGPDRLVLSFAPPGAGPTRVATADAANDIVVYDLPGGRERLRLRGHTDSVYALAWSSERRRIATGSGDGEIRLWDADTGAPGWSIRPAPGQLINGLAFTADGEQLVVLTDHEVWLLDVGSGAIVRRIEADSRGPLRALALSPDGRWLAVARGKAMTFWDVQAWREAGRAADGGFQPMRAAFRGDGDRLVVATGPERVLRVLDVPSGRDVLTLRRHFGAAIDVAFSPDGARIASTGSDDVVKLWDAESGRELLSLSVLSGLIPVRVAFSPDGRWIAAACRGRLILWDAPDQHGDP
jgi:WD40 repeat protein